MIQQDEVPFAARGTVVSAIIPLCIIVALVNLIGWASGTRSLISIVPGLPSMVPVTSVLSLLTVCGLWGVAHGASRGAASRALPQMFLPACAAVACLAIEVCYLSGGAPGPFLLAESGKEHALSLSSPMTAGLMLALNCALLLSVRAARVTAAQIIALTVLLIAMLNLCGYAFRDTLLIRVLPGQGTSIPTSVQLILLGLGVLFLHPRRGLMSAFTGDLPGAAISRRLLFPALLVPVASGVLATAGETAGLYKAHSVLPLFVWSLVVLFLFVIWRFALQLSAADAARAAVQRDLRRALAALQDEHDRKDIFMATLAHEMRNPLAPISSAAEVLRYGGELSLEERQRIGRAIAAQVASLVNIVNDLLDVERLRTRRITLDMQPLDIRLAINGALDQTRPMMERKNHQLSTDLPSGPVIVRGDYARLVQILSNLLSNAAKYTPPGGQVGLRVALEVKQVSVTVADNGIGIPEDLFPQLFEPYVQAELTSDRTHGGLGLGLALVKQLTELHGGSVEARSAGKGQGSSFTVTLPLLLRSAQ